MNSSSAISQGIAPPPGASFLSNIAYMPPGLEGAYKEPFSYTVIFANIANGATQQQSANIQNDSYFVCTAMMADIWDAATGNTTNTAPALAPMLIRILDTSSGKFSMDQPTPLANLFGTGIQPAVALYRAKVYIPGGQLSVELTNGMAAAQRVRLTFMGFKVYPRLADELTG